MNNKRLYKDSSQKMIMGVCAGIAEYFDIDPSIVRIIWVLVACTGAGIIAYIVAGIILPEKSTVI